MNILLSLLVAIFPINSLWANKGSHGGDTNLSSFYQAAEILKQLISQSPKLIDQEQNLLLQTYQKSWLNHLQNGMLKMELVSHELFDDEDIDKKFPRAALANIETQTILLSMPYLLRERPTIYQGIVLLFHEIGHFVENENNIKIGHNVLDKMGIGLVQKLGSDFEQRLKAPIIDADQITMVNLFKSLYNKDISCSEDVSKQQCLNGLQNLYVQAEKNPEIKIKLNAESRVKIKLVSMQEILINKIIGESSYEGSFEGNDTLLDFQSTDENTDTILTYANQVYQYIDQFELKFNKKIELKSVLPNPLVTNFLTITLENDDFFYRLIANGPIKVFKLDCTNTGFENTSSPVVWLKSKKAAEVTLSCDGIDGILKQIRMANQYYQIQEKIKSIFPGAEVNCEQQYLSDCLKQFKQFYIYNKDEKTGLSDKQSITKMPGFKGFVLNNDDSRSEISQVSKSNGFYISIKHLENNSFSWKELLLKIKSASILYSQLNTGEEVDCTSFYNIQACFEKAINVLKSLEQKNLRDVKHDQHLYLKIQSNGPRRVKHYQNHLDWQTKAILTHRYSSVCMPKFILQKSFPAISVNNFKSIISTIEKEYIEEVSKAEYFGIQDYYELDLKEAQAWIDITLRHLSDISFLAKTDEAKTKKVIEEELDKCMKLYSEQSSVKTEPEGNEHFISSYYYDGMAPGDILIPYQMELSEIEQNLDQFKKFIELLHEIRALDGVKLPIIGYNNFTDIDDSYLNSARFYIDQIKAIYSARPELLRPALLESQTTEAFRPNSYNAEFDTIYPNLIDWNKLRNTFQEMKTK